MGNKGNIQTLLVTYLCLSVLIILIVGSVGFYSNLKMMESLEGNYHEMQTLPKLVQLHLDVKESNADTLEMMISTDPNRMNELNESVVHSMEESKLIIDNLYYRSDLDEVVKAELRVFRDELGQVVDDWYRAITLSLANHKQQAYDQYLKKVTPRLDHMFEEDLKLRSLIKERISDGIHIQKQLTNERVMMLLALVITTLLITIHLGNVIHRKITKPFKSIVGGIDRIAAGNLDVQIQIKEDNELRTLGDQINRLTQKMKALISDLNDNAQEEIHHLAYYDELTGFPNRRMFSERVNSIIHTYEQKQKKFTVMFIDLDRFKNINDSLGHNTGDQLLQAVADRWRDCIKNGNMIARWGGDEFTVLLHDVSEFGVVGQLASDLLQVFDTPFVIEGHELHVTASIGIAIYPEFGKDMNTLLMNADSAMYFAKEQGGHNYQFYQYSSPTGHAHRFRLETDLRKALENDEFMIEYQPQVDIQTKQVVGAEALLRWVHPSCGVISPNVFIPIAEETGLICPIGEWVIDTVCEQLKKWQEQYDTTICISINLSVKQLLKGDLVDIINESVERTGIDPGRLEFEITESVFLQSTDDTIATLETIRAMGSSIAIDDFGKGQSALSYFKYLPLYTLKIDQIFVREIVHSKRDRAIVSSLITLAHSLDMKVVAEGVELVEELDILTQKQCDEVQGYLFSKPLSVDAFEELLLTESTSS